MESSQFRFTARNAELGVVIFFQLLFVMLFVQAILIGDLPRSRWAVVAIVLTAIPFLIELKYGIRLPFGMKMMIPFALFLHLAGGIMRWYWTIWDYDKLAHVVSAVALGFVFFTCYLLADYLEFAWKKPVFRKPVQIFRNKEIDVLVGIFMMVAVFGLVWDYSEHLLDVVFMSSYNNGVIDSVTDFLSDLMGALIVLVIAHRSMQTIPTGEHLDYLLRKPEDRTMAATQKEIPRQGPSIIFDRLTLKLLSAVILLIAVIIILTSGLVP